VEANRSHIGAIPLQLIAVHIKIARGMLIDGMNDQRNHAVRHREAALEDAFLEVHVANDGVGIFAFDLDT